MTRIVSIKTDLLIDTSKAMESIDKFTEYAEKKISDLTPKLDFKIDESIFNGITDKVDKLSEQFAKLGEVKEKAIAPKSEEVEKSEKELARLEERVKKVNTSFDDAKTECELYEKQLKDSTLTEQQKININEKLAVAYTNAATEAKRFKTAMENLRSATKDSGAILNQTKLINNLGVTYEDLRVKAKNTKQTLSDGVTAKGTSLDINNFAQLNKQIENSENISKSYRNELKKTNLTESERDSIMMKLAQEYAKTIQLLTMKEARINSVNKNTEQGTQRWMNYQNALSKVSIKLSDAGAKLSNLNSEMSKEKKIDISGIDSEFKKSISGLETDIQRVIIANRSLNNSLQDKQGNLARVSQKYQQLKAAYRDQITSLKSMQNGLNTESKNYKDLQVQINKTESALSKLEIQEQRNTSTMKNSIQRQEQAIAKEQQRQRELRETAAAQKELQMSLGDVIASYSQFYLIMNQARNALKVHQDVDKALTETRKVAELTKEEMREYQLESLGAADSLGLLQTELINATTEFTRLGMAFEEAKQFGELASMGAVVGDIESADQVSEYLIAAIQGFKELTMTADDARKVVDMFNEIANKTSINFEALGEGTKRFAATMSVAGNSIEESLGLLTAGYDVTRDAERVARGLNTIGLRMRGINDEGEEQLELVPKMEATFKKYGITMTKVGEDGLLKMKSTYELLRDISSVWKDQDDFARTNILEAIAGKQQANIAAAIIQNWETVDKSVQLAMNSVGSADTEYSYYMESMEAATNQFKNALAGLYQHVISSDSLIELINIATKFIQKLTEIDPLVYKMVAGFAAGQAASYTLSHSLNGAMKAFTSLKTIMTAFQTVVTGTITATTLLNASLGVVGLIPIVAALGVGLYGLIERTREVNTETYRVKQAQSELNQKMSETESIMGRLQQAIDDTTIKYNEYGEAVEEVNGVQFWENINALVELYPELADKINDTALAYENKAEALKEVQKLINENMAQEQMAIMQSVVDHNQLIAEQEAEYAKLEARLEELGGVNGQFIGTISEVLQEMDGLERTINRNKAETKDLTIAYETASAQLEALGYVVENVNGKLQLQTIQAAYLNDELYLNNQALSDIINNCYDLTTAEGVLAAAFAEMTITGKLSAQMLDLLSKHFDQATVASFTTSDAIIAFANANNLATNQILMDSKSWIAGSKKEIEQHIAHMETLKQHALANENFHYSMGNTGEAEMASLYAKKLEQNIADANAQLKSYDVLLNRVNQLKTPTPNSPNVPKSTYLPESDRKDTSKKKKEKAIDYAKRYAAELRKIADIEAEINKLNSKLGYAKTDAEKFKILNQLAGEYGNKVNALKVYQSKLNAELAKVKHGSDEYYKLRDLLDGVEQQILDTTLAQSDFNNEIMALRKEIEEFDLTSVEHQISVVKNLLDNENLSLAEKQDLVNKLLGLYDQQAKETKDMIGLLKEEQDQYNQNSSEWRDLQKKIWDYELDLMNIEKNKLDLIKDINKQIIEEQEERVKKEIELIKEKLDADLAAIDERIAALKKEKEEQQELDKKKEIQDEIDKLNAEYNALSVDDSLWAKKRKYEIEQAKKDKEEELRKLQEEKEYKERLEALENEKKSLQEEANKKIDRLNTAIENLKDGTKGIDTVLKDVESTLKDSLKSVSNEIVKAITSSRGVTNPQVRSFNLGDDNQNAGAVFNFTFNGIDRNSGNKVANDFITALQAKGYKLR